MSEAEHVRWGDTQAQAWKVPAGFVPGSTLTLSSKQLVAAKCRWPILWALRFGIVPALPTGETATFSVTFQVVVGSGAGMMTTYFTYTLAPVGGVYVPVNDVQSIPASDVQVICQGVVATTALGAAAGTQENINIGAFIAPFTEFHGTQRLYEWMEKSPDEEPAGNRWMHGRPFDDGRLHYK